MKLKQNQFKTLLKLFRNSSVSAKTKAPAVLTVDINSSGHIFRTFSHRTLSLPSFNEGHFACVQLRCFDFKHHENTYLRYEFHFVVSW